MRRGQEYQLPDRQVLTSAVGRIHGLYAQQHRHFDFCAGPGSTERRADHRRPGSGRQDRYANGRRPDHAASTWRPWQRLASAWPLLYVISALFGFFQHYIMATVTLKMSYRMRGDLSAKINRVPQKYFNTHAQGDILSRITNDVSTLQQGLTNSLPTIISAATQFLGCLVMMFVTQWRLALVAAGDHRSAGCCCSLLIMKRSQPYFTARQESLGALNGYVEEMYTGHAVVRSSRANGAGGRAVSTSSTPPSMMPDWRSQFLSGVMQPLMNIIGNLSYVAVCIYGSILAINGTIAFGVIVCLHPLCAAALFAADADRPGPDEYADGCRLRPPNLRLPGERGAVRRGRQDRHPHPSNRRGAVLPRALCLSGHAGEADHPRFLRRRAAGAEGRHRRADRRRENDDGQSADALFRRPPAARSPSTAPPSPTCGERMSTTCSAWSCRIPGFLMGPCGKTWPII